MSSLLGCFSPFSSSTTRIEFVASFGRCEGRYKRSYPASKLLRGDPSLPAECRTLSFFSEARKMLIHCEVAREPYARWDASLLRDEEPHHRRRRVSFRCPSFWRGGKVLGAERAAEVLETIVASGVDVVRFHVRWHPLYDGEAPQGDGERWQAETIGGDGDMNPGSLPWEGIMEEMMAEIDDFLTHQEWMG